MTCYEKLKREHPDAFHRSGAAVGCPSLYGYLPDYPDCGDPDMCEDCWNREIPESVYSASESIAKVQKTFEEAKADILAATKDPVNHPGHYESGKFECIDVMLETQGKEAVMGFCICNAFKYLYRHNRKNGIEDVKKAQWYIDKYLELAEEE